MSEGGGGEATEGGGGEATEGGGGELTVLSWEPEYPCWLSKQAVPEAQTATNATLPELLTKWTEM